MALKSGKQQQQKNSNFVPQEPLQAGTYEARLVQILDLGLQPQRAYKGEDKAPAHEIMLTYELVEEFMKDAEGNELEDKPRWISETLPFYGLYADKAKSTQRYKAFDPEEAYEGDFAQCINTPCNVTIVVNQKGEKVYENIAAVTAMTAKKAAKCPELVNPVKVFDLDDPDLDVFNKLPEWLRDKIKGNLNYAGSVLEKALGGAEKKEDVPKKETKKEAKSPDIEEQSDDVGEDEDTPW